MLLRSRIFISVVSFSAVSAFLADTSRAAGNPDVLIHEADQNPAPYCEDGGRDVSAAIADDGTIVLAYVSGMNDLNVTSSYDGGST
jgi:hypothetical protein